MPSGSVIFTYIKTEKGWSYLCAVMDLYLYSRKIVGHLSSVKFEGKNGKSQCYSFSKIFLRCERGPCRISWK